MSSHACKHFFSKTLLVCLLIAACVVIFSHIALAWYMFPQADEFAHAAAARRRGVLQTVVDYYLSWGGRFSELPLLMSLGSLPIFPRHLGVLGIVILSGFAVVLIVYFRLISKNRSLISAPLVDTAFLMLVLSPQLKSQVFFWIGGGVTYQLSLTLAMALLAFCVHVYPRPPAATKKSFALLFIAAFLSGGFNQILTATLILVAATYCTLNYTHRKDAYWRCIAWIAVAFILALFCMLIAPGNYARRSNFMTGGFAGWDVIAQNGFRFFRQQVVMPGLVLIGYGLLRGLCFPYRTLDKVSTVKIGLYALALTMGMCATCILAAYGLNGFFMEERIAFAPLMLFAITMPMFASVLFSRAIKKVPNIRCARAIVGVSVAGVLWLAFAPVSEAGRQLMGGIRRAEGQYRVAIKQIDMAEQAVREGKTDVNLPPIPDLWEMPAYAVLQPSSDHWVNGAFAMYYGFKTVSSR